jgi:hypothetical protein
MMTETAKKKSVWRKPPTGNDKAGSDRQEHRERRYDILSNLLTLLLTGIIIAGGILLPNLLYPYLDRYRDETVQLEGPSEGAIAAYTFDEPVSLYPWNLYEEQRLRALTSTERDLLDERGIPDFLIATLRDHGMDIPSDNPDAWSYRAQILGSFRYLQPDDSAEPGCYVLYDADIDAEGQPDLRCAVDLQANIISLLFVSDNLSALEVGAPLGSAPGAATGDAAGTAAAGAADGRQAPDATQEQESARGATAGNPTDTANGDSENTGGTPAAEIEGETGITGTGETTQTDDAAETGGATGTGTNPEVEVIVGSDTQPEYQPPEEERYLWSFAYATAREAQAFNQPSLMRAFRQLEYTYENRWGYPYTTLLATPPTESETGFPGDEYTPLLPPTPFKTTDYLLNIYNLSDGNHLILYLDPETSHCMGFNLQTS